MDNKYTVVDLFCGCGGLSRGLERTGRFQTVLGVDIKKNVIETFRANHGVDGVPPAIFHGDINDLHLDDVMRLLEPFGIKAAGDLDCLVGGPPCEGFSTNKVYTHGVDEDLDAVPAKTYQETKYWQQAWAASTTASRRSRAYHPFLSDPRNFLFRAFLLIAEALRPRLILIENVRQMFSHNEGAIKKEILERLDELGYQAEARILNAADFGVPQVRHRAFFVAVRRDSLLAPNPPWPSPTHRAPPKGKAVAGLPGDQGFHVSVEEAIRDLPAARSERALHLEQDSRFSPSPTSRVAAKIEDRYPDAELTAFRQWVRSSQGPPANHVYREPGEPVLEKMRAMRPGMKAHHLPSELQPKKYYYNAYGRLDWHLPSNTITKSFIYPGSGRFGHPEDVRILTYREAARLQSFDDDFTFYASSQEGFAHMIGSAVPPRLGHAFGEAFLKVLDTPKAPKAPKTPKTPKTPSPRRRKEKV